MFRAASSRYPVALQWRCSDARHWRGASELSMTCIKAVDFHSPAAPLRWLYTSTTLLRLRQPTHCVPCHLVRALWSDSNLPIVASISCAAWQTRTLSLQLYLRARSTPSSPLSLHHRRCRWAHAPRKSSSIATWGGAEKLPPIHLYARPWPPSPHLTHPQLLALGATSKLCLTGGSVGAATRTPTSSTLGPFESDAHALEHQPGSFLASCPCRALSSVASALQSLADFVDQQDERRNISSRRTRLFSRHSSPKVRCSTESATDGQRRSCAPANLCR